MPSQTPISYENSPLYADLTPIPLPEDASPNPTPQLAAISYPEQYTEAMSYLRAIMAANEISERALILTEDIIEMNPAHYTVWGYRAGVVIGLGKKSEGEERGLEDKVKQELKWVEERAGANLKNYQIWHHRQQMMGHLSAPPSNEPAFLDRVLSLDTKNYHVWTYRQWLVRHFSLWDSPAEYASVEKFIQRDVRNNSAWNHRWFLCFGKDELAAKLPPDGQKDAESASKIIDLDLLDREIEYTKAKIQLAPQNPSPWSYLRALARKSAPVGGATLSTLQPFATQFIGTSSSAEGEGEGESEGEGGRPREDVQSTYALDFVAEGLAEEGKAKEAKEIWLRSLAGKWDPIRKGWWEYRAELVSRS